MNESITPDTVRLALNNLDARLKFLESRDVSEAKARIADLETENKRLRGALSMTPCTCNLPRARSDNQAYCCPRCTALAQEPTNG
jgi:hypothetical protein